eukprot:c23388_g2_i2 orf=735-2588(-)
MSMGYTYKHGHISEVPRGTPDPSPPSLQQARNGRQLAQAHMNSNVREGSKRQADYAQGQYIHVNSPISSLSPPQSSTSSELLSHSESNYQYECDMYKSEISSCSQYASSESNHNQVLQRAALSPVGSPESAVAFAGSHSNVADSALSSATDMSVSDNEALMRKLQELESALMGPEDANTSELVGENRGGSWGELLDDFLQESHTGPYLDDLAISEETQQERNAVETPVDSLSAFEHSLELSNPGSRVKNLLIKCASAIDEEKMDVAELTMQDLRSTASVYGDPLERLAAYMSEGLVARLYASGSTIYKALKCWEAPAVEVLSAMQKLYEICPYIKFAYMAANGAIAEAFKDEPMVHIFDFQIDQGTQWLSLMHALASRPGGTPYMRISTVDDPTAQTYPLGGMQSVKKRLAKLASNLGVPFEFTTISTKLSDLQAHMIERRPGEALAINFALQLHHMPDESVSLDNTRDCLLRTCKYLNPKVLTLIEQDANTNTTPFLARFMETLDYYSAVFESIDVALPRESKDRVNVEEHCLARDIVNVIACEGVQRVERHELAGKWRARMSMAGFRPYPLSMYVNHTIKCLLESYNEKYKLKQDGEVLLLGWLNRSLMAASAWC